MLNDLFAQHPAPWRADCALTEFEAQMRMSFGKPTTARRNERDVVH